MGESRYSLEEAFPATAHARALAEAAGDRTLTLEEEVVERDRTLTLEEEVVEINRQIEKLGEADEEEAIQMLNAELQAEEEAVRAEEEAAFGEGEGDVAEGTERAGHEADAEAVGDGAHGGVQKMVWRLGKICYSCEELQGRRQQRQHHKGRKRWIHR